MILFSFFKCIYNHSKYSNKCIRSTIIFIYNYINGISTKILPIILNSSSVSCFLLKFDFLLSHTANFDESNILPFLLSGFYFLYFFYTSSNMITLFYKQTKIFDELLKSLDFLFLLSYIIVSQHIIY